MMTSLVKLKQWILVLGDFTLFYIALLITLFIRYRSISEELLLLHIWPFTFLSILWLLIFYISGCYDTTKIRNSIEFQRIFTLAILINAVVSMALFYLGVFGITPKTNLAIFVLVFGILESLWHKTWNASKNLGTQINVLVIGTNQNIDTLIAYVTRNQRLGYRIEHMPMSHHTPHAFETLKKIIAERTIHVIVVPHYMKQDATISKTIYELFSLGIEIIEFSSFYEIIFGKIPLDEVEETWLIENIARKRPLYQFAKRYIDVCLACTLILITAPIQAIIALLISLTSRGPVIYTHRRIGEKGREFTLYKFRSMVPNDSLKWPKENDDRITPLGKILRRTHLDELPQLINVIRGELSFVGPRPDFMEFFTAISNNIPYYRIRTLVRPGISGWAQIHYPITASLEETRERLAYDLYYLKHRSLVLDLGIILKTVKIMLTGAGR
jgi:exopolysaccharide biosynthesis polyprenyl glycosylphosphotransferase